MLVSSGDSGAFIESKKQAQASFPASDPWVLACGGTTIGNVNGPSFTEYVWNDTWQGGSGRHRRRRQRDIPCPAIRAA